MQRIVHNVKAVTLDVIKSPFLWSFAALYGLYWLVTPLLPKNAMLEASSVLVLIGGLAILATWFASFVLGVASGARIGAWQLPVGIWLTWFGISEQRTWTLIWRFSDQPDWMMSHHFVGQANWVIFISSFLYLISPGNETGEIPVKNWYVLIGAIAVGMFAAGAVIATLILRP